MGQRSKSVAEWNVENCPRCLLLHGLTLVWRERPVENKTVWESARAHVEDMVCEGQHVN